MQKGAGNSRFASRFYQKIPNFSKLSFNERQLKACYACLLYSHFSFMIFELFWMLLSPLAFVGSSLTNEWKTAILELFVFF